MYTHVHVHTTAEPASLSSSFARAHVSRRIRISRGRAAWRHRTVPTLRRADLGLELPASSLCAGSQGKAHPSRGAITPSLRGRYFWARLVAPAPRAAAGRVSEVRRVSGAACRASLPSQACRQSTISSLSPAHRDAVTADVAYNPRGLHEQRTSLRGWIQRQLTCSAPREQSAARGGM